MDKLLCACAVALGLSTIPAHDAESMWVTCKQRSEIVEILDKKFNETLRFFALQNDGNAVEFFASDDGSWTAFITYPSGWSCPFGSGEAWADAPPPPRGDPA